ncbi:MAG: ATP-binding cassette domain-containing protein [Pseudomonadota bacterium]|nr:ATP-binding cassette domain-containing protein [Pseudomonadota bacterium]
MVELESLSKHFGPVVAVDKITLNVAKGEVLGFLGPNGAGKTTTMRMISGYLSPTFGSISICGYNVEHSPIQSKKMIGYLAEGSPSYEDMTVLEFLNFVASIRGINGDVLGKRLEEVISQTSLGEVVNRKIEVLSKGFKRRVGLAQSIIHDPPVLILDEPTDGLDPNQKHEVRKLIRNMSSDKAIIISTHILEEVEAVCSRAVIIGNGKLLADGTSEKLLSLLPDYNAIDILVEEEQKSTFKNFLESLDLIDGVKEKKVKTNLISLTCTSESNPLSAPSIIAEMSKSNLFPLEVYKSKGDLDTVFRQITLGNEDSING